MDPGVELPTDERLGAVDEVPASARS